MLVRIPYDKRTRHEWGWSAIQNIASENTTVITTAVYTELPMSLAILLTQFKTTAAKNLHHNLQTNLSDTCRYWRVSLFLHYCYTSSIGVAIPISKKAKPVEWNPQRTRQENYPATHIIVSFSHFTLVLYRKKFLQNKGCGIASVFAHRKVNIITKTEQSRKRDCSVSLCFRIDRHGNAGILNQNILRKF